MLFSRTISKYRFHDRLVDYLNTNTNRHIPRRVGDIDEIQDGRRKLWRQFRNAAGWTSALSVPSGQEANVYRFSLFTIESHYAASEEVRHTASMGALRALRESELGNVITHHWFRKYYGWLTEEIVYATYREVQGTIRIVASDYERRKEVSKSIYGRVVAGVDQVFIFFENFRVLGERGKEVSLDQLNILTDSVLQSLHESV